MTAPHRKITTICTPEWIARKSRDRRGKRYTAILECGHLDTVNTAEKRQGWVFCFDCHYGKPTAT